MSLLGLDIGTTGCKAMLFAVDGRVLGQARREYTIQTPQPGWAEQDAEQVWRLARELLRVVIAAASVDPPVALALSCQGEAVIPVDAKGVALRPAILGMDTRTTAENAWLVQTFGAEELFLRTGMPVHTINTLPKLLWLQRHEPAIWRRRAPVSALRGFFPAPARRGGGHQHLPGLAHAVDGAGDGRLGRRHSCPLRHRTGAPGQTGAGHRRRGGPVASSDGGGTGSRHRGAAGQRRPRPGVCGLGQRRYRAGAGHGLDGHGRGGGGSHGRRLHWRLRCATAASPSIAMSCQASTWR